tara:strand:- start:1444 stop:1656 length:213 start_codon:yes stop_codon:yes gene_type:complete
MKVCEGNIELQELILEYFDVRREDGERFDLVMENGLYHVRYELMTNYHYDSPEDKKKSMKIIKMIDALGL